MLDRVVHAVAPPARGNGRGLGRGEVQQPRLRRRGGGGLDDEGRLVAGALEADHEPLVALLEHEHVLGRVGADPMAPDLVLPPGVVDPRVEQPLLIGGERDAVTGAGHGLVEHLAGGEVQDPQREPLVPGGVHRIGEQGVVGGEGQPAEGVELVPRGLGLGVQQHLLAREHHPRLDLRHRARVGHAGEPRVVVSGGGAGDVPPVPATHRHRQVRLLRVTDELLDQALPQRPEVRGAGVGVGVLRLEVRDDLGIGLVAHPLVRIHHDIAVVDPLGGASLGGGGVRVLAGHPSRLVILRGRRRPAGPGARRLPRRGGPRRPRGSRRPAAGSAARPDRT